MTEAQSPPEAHYSSSLINEALSDLPADLAESILGRIVNLAAEKKLLSEIKQAQIYSAELAIVAHQNFATNTPGMLDVISWERATYDYSITFLRSYAKSDERVKEHIPRSVIDFAACYYTQRVILDDNYESIESLLTPAGYNLGSVYDKFIELLIRVDPSGPSKEEVESKYQTIDDFYVCLPMELHEIGNVLEQAMRSDLASSGFRLPELGSDNTYGLGSDGCYIYPVVDESILPS